MIEKTIRQIAANEGKNLMQVFNDFIDYIIHGHNPSGGPMTGWVYRQASNKLFFDCYAGLIQEYRHRIAKDGWCDPLGDLFMQLLGKKSAQYNGVFFTPEGICELIAQATVSVKDLEKSEKKKCGAFGFRNTVSDPSCGSGRNLLAVASKFMDKPRKELPFFVGEDIDATCCGMTAVNLMMHGLPGEVICHDTLTEPDTCKFFYVVNEGMFPLPGGLPTIRKLTDPARSITLRARDVG